MAIQTDVTLQLDYTCCLRMMGENPALQKLLFDHLAACQSSTIVNTSCVIFCPQGGVTSLHCSLLYKR